MNATENLKFDLGRVENIMENRKNAGLQMLTYFQMASNNRSLKFPTVWYRAQCDSNNRVQTFSDSQRKRMCCLPVFSPFSIFFFSKGYFVKVVKTRDGVVKFLALYHIIPTFNKPDKDGFEKHCGKRRKC